MLWDLVGLLHHKRPYWHTLQPVGATQSVIVIINNLVQHRLRQCRCVLNSFIRVLPQHLWLLQITITLTESALLIFFAIRGRKITGMAADWTDNLSSHSGACNNMQHRVLRVLCVINTFMRVQAKKPIIIGDYYFPDWGCVVDFFLHSWVENCWHG